MLEVEAERIWANLAILTNRRMRSTRQNKLEILAGREYLPSLEVQDKAFDVIIPLWSFGGERLHIWHVATNCHTRNCWPAISAESWALDIHAIKQTVTDLFLRMPNECHLPLAPATTLKTLRSVVAVLTSLLQKLPFRSFLVETHGEGWPRRIEKTPILPVTRIIHVEQDLPALQGSFGVHEEVTVSAKQAVLQLIF